MSEEKCNQIAFWCRGFRGMSGFRFALPLGHSIFTQATPHVMASKTTFQEVIYLSITIAKTVLFHAEGRV